MATEGFNKSRFVRQQLFDNENLTLKQLQQAWRKDPDAPRGLPKQQDIYSAVSVLRRRYFVEALPYLTQGSYKGRLNCTELSRSIKKAKPKLDANDIHEMLTNDGFEISLRAIEQALYIRGEHPDPKHGKGARAGKPEKSLKKSAGTDRRSKAGRVNVAELKAVKNLIDELGGIEPARKAIEAVKRAGDVRAAETALDALEELQLD